MDLFDWWSITFLVYLLGIVFSLDAIWQGRTAQGTIAWGLALLLLPIVGIPLYLLFGTRKFHGYRLARRQGDAVLMHWGTISATSCSPMHCPPKPSPSRCIIFSACR